MPAIGLFDLALASLDFPIAALPGDVATLLAWLSASRPSFRLPLSSGSPRRRPPRFIRTA